MRSWCHGTSQPLPARQPAIAPWVPPLMRPGSMRLLLPLLLVLTALLAMLVAGEGLLPAPLQGLALLLCSGAALLAGTMWGRQHQLDCLRQARQQAQQLAQLIDRWTWQTDADHRLVRLQPPPGAPAAAWTHEGDASAHLWLRFDDAQHSLRPRMEAQQPLQDIEVARAQPGDDTAPAWCLRGLPRLDGSGRFEGYTGVAWPLGDPAPAVTAQPAPGVLPDDSAAEALAAEHAAFSYTISHDLRAPIRVVEGFGRILKEDYGAQLDRVGRDHIDRVLAAAARMNHMIDALLSLSKLSTQPLQRQPVNLSQLAGFVIDELRRAHPERQVEVHIAPGMVAQGDPTLLRMALENLLGNAWKYSAKVAQAVVRFEPELQDGQPGFLISDNGAGFDMRFADRLFGVFQRLHSSSDFQGNGVGLASVQRIVRRHGGEIWAESEVGQGARFHFRLKD